MDHKHAYGNGAVAPRESWLRTIVWLGLSPFILRARNRLAITRAWKQFDRQATVSKESWLGPNAWCVNSLGDRSRIVLEGKVVCRGLLRVENYGAGKILIHPNVYIGDDCLISSAESIEIGSYTLFAHGVQVFDNNSHPVDWQMRLNDWQATFGEEPQLKPPIPSAPIKIGQYVWIGFNSAIMKGVTIGDKSVIAAGSIVTKDVPPLSLVAGNPAVVVKSL